MNTFTGVPDPAIEMWPKLQKKAASLFRTKECTGNSSGLESPKATATFCTLGGFAKKMTLHTYFYFSLSKLLIVSVGRILGKTHP